MIRCLNDGVSGWVGDCQIFNYPLDCLRNKGLTTNHPSNQLFTLSSNHEATVDDGAASKEQ